MNVFQDVRFGFRMLAKKPGFTAVVVAVLGLGIGANATIFTIVNAALFRSLPFRDGDRIVFINCHRPAKSQRMGTSMPDFLDWRAQAKSFEGIAGYTWETFNLSGGTAPPERFVGARMTVNSFSLLGERPVLGRDFSADDGKAGAAAVVILGHGVWKNRYGASPDVLGAAIRIDDAPATVVGVMPEGFRFPTDVDLWMPLKPDAQAEKRDFRVMPVWARTAAGVSLEAARTEMDLIAKRLEKEYPNTNEGIRVMIQPYAQAFNGGQIRAVLLALLGAVGFVLLIACANVANMLLSRAVSRSLEMSIRAALGAGRWRVIRQLLVESLLLGGMGGLLGLLLAVWGTRAFDLAVAGTGKPYWIVFSFDWRVFSYFAGISLLTSLLFGLAPAVHASSASVGDALKEGSRGTGGRRSGFLTGALVVTEFALAAVLLAGAGLMVRSFLNAYNLKLGVDKANLLTMRMNLVRAKYPANESRTAFIDRLQPKLDAIPGVEAAAVTSHLPGRGANGYKFAIEGKPRPEEGREPSVDGIIVSPGYFRAAGVTVVQGRGFTDSDGAPGTPPVAIVNQRFVAKHLDGQDATGRRIQIGRSGEKVWLTVVGVCTDVRQNDWSREELDPVIYQPFRQDPMSGFAIVARTKVTPQSVVPAFRSAVQSVDRDLPVWDVQTLDESLDRGRWPYRVFGAMFSIFAAIALVLAAVGIYAVIAYSVSGRTQEIGVRMALGASATQVFLLVMKQGALRLGIGLAIGMAGAFGLTRVLSGVLMRVKPGDPLTLAVSGAILLLGGLLACWIPAMRATRLDPTVALRNE